MAEGSRASLIPVSGASIHDLMLAETRAHRHRAAGIRIDIRAGGEVVAKAGWLVKSEPETYAFQDLQRDGRTTWDGVRNNAAALHLKAMKVGDEVLFYHSQVGLAVVGIARVERAAFPDPSDPKGRFVAVELSPVRPLSQPVTLAQMKAAPELAGLAMLRQSRLSVSPISAEEWTAILKMAGDGPSD